MKLIDDLTIRAKLLLPQFTLSSLDDAWVQGTKTHSDNLKWLSVRPDWLFAFSGPTNRTVLTGCQFYTLKHWQKTLPTCVHHPTFLFTSSFLLCTQGRQISRVPWWNSVLSQMNHNWITGLKTNDWHLYINYVQWFSLTLTSYPETMILPLTSTLPDLIAISVSDWKQIDHH